LERGGLTPLLNLQQKQISEIVPIQSKTKAASGRRTPKLGNVKS
jgi:hypothetical protein